MSPNRPKSKPNSPGKNWQYNGKDGQPAYVAVDGVVYDVTQSGAWANGEHNGFEAGKDLTDALANDAPHDDSNLDGFPVVGTLVD